VRAIHVVKLALLAIVLAFVGYALVKQFQKIDWATIEVHVGSMLIATAFLIAVSTVQMISYRSLLAAYAAPPSWRAMAAVAWVPPLGKYVPGKVAAILGAVYMLKRYGVGAAVAVSVVLVLDGLAVIAGLISGSPILAWEPVRRVLPGGWIYASVLVLIGVICLHPLVFSRLVNFALRKIGRAELPRFPDLSHYLIPVICAFAQWLFAGLALWWMTRSVAEVPANMIGWFVSIAALAMTVSYLALFAPGGLGVREAIYLGALASIPGVGAKAALVAALMRIAQTLVEVGLAGFGTLLTRQSGAKQHGAGETPAPR
jgi:glycosyltransferase 2 family protein